VWLWDLWRWPGCSVQDAFAIFDYNRTLADFWHLMTCDLWPTATIQGIFCWFYWWTPGHQWKHWTGNGYLDQTEFYRFLVACDCRAGPVAAELNARICPSRVNWDCLKSVVPSCILHVSSGNGKILTRSKPPSPQVVEVKLYIGACQSGTDVEQMLCLGHSAWKRPDLCRGRCWKILASQFDVESL